MNKTVVNTIYYSIGEILPKVINFLLLPVLTKYLSPADYGITAYTSTVMTLITVIGALALNSYVLRYYFIYKDEESRKKVIGTAFLSICAFNIIIVGLAFLFLPLIIDKYDIQVAWNPYFKFAIVINFLESFTTIPLCLYRVKQKANKYVLLNISRTVLTVALNLFFIVYLLKGVAGYYYAHLLAVIPFVPIYIAIIAKNTRLAFSFSFLKEGLAFSLPLVPGAIAFFLINAFDRIILERNVDMSQLGLYNIAATVVSALAIVVQSGYHAFEPELYSRHGTNGYNLFVQKVQVAFYSAIFIMGMLISLFSQDLLFFFTSDKFHGAYLFVPLLMVKAVISGQNVVYNTVLQGDRRSKTEGAITLIGAVGSVMLNIVLIPKLGVWGAAVAGAISLFLMNVLEFINMHLEGKSMYREVLLTILLLVMSYGTFLVFPHVSWGGIIIKFAVLIAYLLAICLIYQINPKGIKELLLTVKK